MNYRDPQNQNIESNADEEARMRNEEGVLRALPLTPEEKLSIEKAEQEQRTTMNLEKAKESAWTHKKLKKLAIDGGVKKRKSPNKNPKEFDLPAGGITEDLDTVAPIIVERLGEPREFTEDINIIRNGLKEEKLVVEGNEMQAINLSGEKYLFGLLIRRHIFEQGYSITIGDNDQPILRDERPNPDNARKERMKGLQDVLGGYEFSKNIGSPFSKNDNTSLLSEYIAAETYEEKPNLVDHRNALARKVGIISPTVSPEQAKQILESTSLDPREKSFLLAWQDTGKDAVLTDIQSNQETFVKNARENFNQKSPEMNRKELMERPFTKIPQLLMMGAAGAGLLFLAAKQWKKGGIWGGISGLILGLIGFSIVSNQADGAWKKLGLGEELNNVVNKGTPVDRKEALQNPFNISIITPIKTDLARFQARLQARLAGGEEGINILMNEKVGQKIATEYPVYSMLNNLNPNERMTPTGKYSAPVETGTKISDVETGFKNLKDSNPPEKAQLNTLLTDTWERYKKTDTFDWEKAKTTTLKDMLAAIEKEDGWPNALINPFSDEPEKQKALNVIGQNPAAWGDIKLDDLKGYFLSNPVKPNTAIEKNLQDYRDTHKNGPDPKAVLIQYLQILDLSNGAMTLREYLSKT